MKNNYLCAFGEIWFGLPTARGALLSCVLDLKEKFLLGDDIKIHKFRLHIVGD